MQISYCDSCGMRISPDDIDSGAALQESAIGSFCAKCAPSRRAAQAPARLPARQTPSGTRAPRVATAAAPRQNQGPQQKAKKDVILIAAAAGVLALVFIVYLLRGKSEPESVTKSSDSPAIAAAPDAVKPIKPAENKPVVPLGTKPPEPIAKTPEATPAVVTAPAPKEEIDDIRLNYAKRKWTELRVQAERAATYTVRRQIIDFSASYKSLAIGKEADEFFKRLAPVDPPLPEPTAIFADYHRDFKPDAPAPGWRYLWNQAEIGVSNQYGPLVWSAKKYAYCPNAEGYPNAPPAGYLHLDPGGGHPGSGIGQRPEIKFDRFGIAAYTLQAGQNGKMAILGMVSRNDRVNNGTLELRIYVNDNQKLVKQVEFKKTYEPLEFAINFNALKESDNIFVCVGPDKDDGCDTFSLDFSLYSIP